MASLFDTYARSKKVEAPSHSILLDDAIEDDTPIFSRNAIDFSPPEPVRFLRAANNVLVICLMSNRLLRIHMEHPDQPEEIDLGSTELLHGLYLDPTGGHVIASFCNGDNFYLSRHSKKTRPLLKLKGHVITSVAWNRCTTPSDVSTGEMLVGSQSGILLALEICVTSEDSRFFQSNVEQYCKQLYNFGKEDRKVISGLVFANVESKFYILVSIEGRLYQFIGQVSRSQEPPLSSQVFSKYDDEVDRFLELPGHLSPENASGIEVYGGSGVPTTFSWTTGSGVLYGKLDTSTNIEDSVTLETKLIPYNNTELPIGVSLTEFHLLMLFQDKLVAMCTLNDEVVYTDTIDHVGEKPLGMCRDPIKGTVWVYTSRSVYKYRLIREARDVWQTYLAQEQFQLAKKFCSDNRARLDKVLTKEAEYFYKQEMYTRAAETYALTDHSFEDIALLLMRISDRSALIKFLRLKLSQAQKSDHTQITMLVCWLVEIYLYRIGSLKLEDNNYDASLAPNSVSARSDANGGGASGIDLASSPADASARYQLAQKEFMEFLSSPEAKECVSSKRSMIYDLIGSHGLVSESIKLANLLGDLDCIVRHYLRLEHWTKALNVISSQNDSSLIVKYSTSLIHHKPTDLVDLWISRDLDPKALISILVSYKQTEDKKPTDVIRYLEHCVFKKKTRHESLHNFLISLYVKHSPNKLLAYLESQGNEAELVHYDVEYALRICSEHKLTRACVFIYSAMGLYQESVRLALQEDITLAKQQANLPENDQLLKKKLWLEIAKYVVDKETDIQQAMALLRECDLLQIDDVLPFFPDFVTIDHFKEAICVTLEEYNHHIESLKQEMNNATQSAADIREDILNFRKQYSSVKITEKCSKCKDILMSSSIYVFPCSHRFHCSCLIDQVMENMSPSKRSLVISLQSKISSKSISNQYSKVQDELDSLVAAECIYCGDAMIRSIDEPFIKDEDYMEIMQTWS